MMTAPGFRWNLVLSLAVAQLVSWGSLYYSFAVLSLPMAGEMGWSKAEVSGALSAGLAATGLASIFSGRIIDRHGGRALMTGGSLAAAALLLAWSQARELWHLYAVWIMLGAVFSAVLYEPVFAVMARELKGDYRRGIVVITLLGGLASTVFIPLCHFLTEAFGWRSTLMVLAALQIPFGAAAHWSALRHSSAPAVKPANAEPSGARVRRAMAGPVFWLLAVSYAAHSFMFTAISFNILPMLAESGFSSGDAVLAYSLVGPSQLAGRSVIFALERRINVRLAGLVATGLPVIGVILLLLASPGSPLLYGFAVFYGCGMGIKTIVQATAAPELLGREGYGALQGAFAAVNYAVQAATPFAAALVWSLSENYGAVRWLILAVTALSALAFAGALVLGGRAGSKG